ncbi:unnamed protein product [Prunus armeniaca]
MDVSDGVLYSCVERYSELLDILLMFEGSDQVGVWSWLDLTPSRHLRLVLFLLDLVDLMEEEADGGIGMGQVDVEGFYCLWGSWLMTCPLARGPDKTATSIILYCCPIVLISRLSRLY